MDDNTWWEYPPTPACGFVLCYATIRLERNTYVADLRTEAKRGDIIRS